MPTNEQQNNQQPEPENEEISTVLEVQLEYPIQAMETEAEAPFAGFTHDPGLDSACEQSLEAGIEAGDEMEEEAATEPPEPIVYRDLSATELQAAVEATLFMHHRPLAISRIRELVNPSIDEEEYRTAVSNLMANCFDETRGIELVEVGNGYQFRTKSEHKDIVRRIYLIAPMKLTNAMLEVLAIVAYNQPLTREGIDKVRGVDSSHLVRVLLDKKMLRIAGKSDDLGRPMLYGTSKEFLELFGLRDLSALPSLRELEEMLPKNEVGAISEEEALASEMEGIVAASKPVEFNDLEVEDWEDETQTVNERQERDQQTEETSLARANRDGSETRDSRAPDGPEAGGDADLPAEIARHLTPGQEGNA